MDCGETDIDVLEFDHVRGVKHMDVSKVISNTLSVGRLMEEIAKCDVRCANCHRRVTKQRAAAAKKRSHTSSQTIDPGWRSRKREPRP